MKYLIILFLLSFTFNSYDKINYDQSLKESYQISYNRTKKLKWADFKKVNNNSKTAALTSSGITYITNQYKNYNEVLVSCVFDKNESYCNGNNNTDYILNHEQKHFDITYIFCNKFINRLKEQNNLNGDKILFIYNQIINEWEEYQKKYDLETNNSINKVEQERWNKIVELQLN